MSYFQTCLGIRFPEKGKRDQRLSLENKPNKPS